MTRTTTDCSMPWIALAALCLFSHCQANEAPECQLRIEPEGGRIAASSNSDCSDNLSGLMLDVPAHAVSVPTTITLRPVPSMANSDEHSVGQAFILSPPLVQFEQPVSLFLPYDRTGISYRDELRPMLRGERVKQDNPLRHVVLGAEPRAFVTTTKEIGGAYESLVVIPSSFGGSALLTEVENFDILFVIDNSPSMADNQAELIKHFGDFIDDIWKCKGVKTVNIGLISTDVGLHNQMGMVWPGSYDDLCNTTEGDDGRLLAKTCRDRGLKDKNCMTACIASNPGIKDGANFIKIDHEHMTTNVGAYDAQNVKDAFGCMAYLGNRGCGVESPFRALKLALSDKHRGRFDNDNTGFFRYDSADANKNMLAIVFIMDEDDGSIADGMHDWSDPVHTVPLAMGATPIWSNYGHLFRPFAMSTKCTQPLTTDGSFSGCQADPAAVYLEPVDKVAQNLFEMDPMTGLNKRNVIVAEIIPKGPIDLLVRPRLAMSYMGVAPAPVKLKYDPGVPGTTDSQLLMFDQNQCGTSSVYTSPQYRMSFFAEQDVLRASYQADICDPTDYSGVMAILAESLKLATPTKCM